MTQIKVSTTQCNNKPGYIFKHELKCFALAQNGEERTALNNGSSTCSFAVAANELHICTVILCNTAGYQVCSKTVALYPGHVARALRVLPLPLLSSRRSRAIARHLPYFAKSTNFRSCARRHGKLLRARGSFRNCAHVDKSLTNTNFA